MQTVIKRIITGFSLLFIFLTSFIYLPPIYLSVLLIASLVWILLFEWPNLFNPAKLPFWLIMPFYPIMPFILLILLNHNPSYRNLLLILFILVAAYDSGSYAVGISLGRHKIAPLISPAKTWEGFFGGYVCTLLALILLLGKFDVSVSFYFVVVFTLLISIIAFFGDLFESLLKRQVQIKDSGTILPGHGGLLDRFDGILFVAFFFYFFKNYLVSFLLPSNLLS